MATAIKYADALKKEISTAAFIPYSSHVTQNAVKLANGSALNLPKGNTATIKRAASNSIDISAIIH